EDAFWSNFFQACREVGAGEGIVQGLANDEVGGRAIEFWQKRPARRARREIVFRATAMLHENHHAGPFAYLRAEPVDSFDDAAQIVLRLPIEEPDLHIDDDQ